MRLGVMSDVHGVAAALDAVLHDARHAGVDRWLVLGDLVLFGPQPVEVVETLAALADAAFVRGNTDRYVLTDEQPRPHRSAEDVAGDADLVRRYALMVAGSAWTRGVLDQAGVLGFLDALGGDRPMTLADGTRLLGVHASPGMDDGPGIDTGSSASDLAQLLADADGDWVIGGHTHDPTDRVVGVRRALNPGSVGLPRSPGRASWMLIDASTARAAVEHRTVAFDVDAVVSVLERRRHPNRAFVASVFTRGPFVDAHRGPLARERPPCEVDVTVS